MKYLFLANSSKQLNSIYESKDRVDLTYYYIPSIEAALTKEYEVYVGINRKYPTEICSNYPIRFYDANIYRSIINVKDNFTAYKNLSNLLGRGDFDVVHCNTPIGGLLGRICGKKAKVRRIIYTAHGFHFYKGQNLVIYKIFLFIEKLLSKMTDAVITINSEDYKIAQKFKLRNNGKVYKINGVGIKTKVNRNSNDELDLLKSKLSISEDEFVLLVVGDLVKNKNIPVLIKAVKKLGKQFKLLVCGDGPHKYKLQRIVNKYNLNDQVLFLGFRSDITLFYQIADVFLHSSFREGLPRVVMEAMTYSLPCVVSKIRGNVDLIEDKINGVLCNPRKYNEFVRAIKYVISDESTARSMGEISRMKIRDYDVEIVKKQMIEIYNEVLR